MNHHKSHPANSGVNHNQSLPSRYNPTETEGRIYNLWLENNAFAPKIDPEQKPFTIAIPPPNVTGSLHMGHALNNTIQDILIRRSRMKGVPTLWIPGTDHAGIATQNIVEKQLAKAGKNKKDLGRDEFEKEVWKWVDEYGHIIIDQLKKLGCSCDWSRQRFTMDEGYSEAVKTAFLHYYQKGWIYQGERVINWCVRCQTALSDIEVEHREVEGKLYYIKYPIKNDVIPSEVEESPANAGLKQVKRSFADAQDDKSIIKYITVATTRPETMLGDTAVAVNPHDQRYQDLIGKKVTLPLVGREIPIIADESVDPKFGTGAVKVTPAHDLNDFEIAERHKLEKIKVINEIGKITQNQPNQPQRLFFTGQKSLEARENIVKELESQGLIEKVQDYTHPVPHCYRCGRVIEQLLSKQWFLKMSELAKPAIEAVEKGEIKFTPQRWEKVYLDWMKNLKDWCISRQIWWGHRIPIEQSSDVLDTWFSSALWPFATLGWPQNSKDVIASEAKQSNNKIAASPLAPRNDKLSDLDYFYPTTVLSTARDIIYLWVSRMIFSGFEFMNKKPFSEVYIHPTVFNISGKRMSKSLGTGVDPLELIEKYGADATRFGLTYINTGIQDIKFDENAILAGQKFANKIWNIARFVMIQCHSETSVEESAANAASEINSEIPRDARNDRPEPKTKADKKILNSLNHLITSVNADLDHFHFGQAAHSLYDFIWHDFADIYIEETKGQEDKETTSQILLYVLTTSLKLLHPLMPFLTESIWQTLKEQNLVKEKMLINATWPE